MATATFTGNTQSGSPYWGGYFRVDLSESNQNASTNTSRVNWAAYFYFGSGYSTLQNGHLDINGTRVWTASGIYHMYNSADMGQTVFLASGYIDVTHNADGTKTVNVNGGTSLYNSDSYQSNFNNNFTLDTLNVVPGQPTGLSVSGHNDSDPTTATLSWTAPSSGATVVNAWVQVSTNSAFSGALFMDSQAAWTTSKNLTGLAKNTTYYYRVAAGGSYGWGSWSATSSFTTGTTAPGAPSTPWTGTITYTSIQVNWNAPADDGGTAITSYTVERATNSAFTAGVQAYTGILAGSPYTITGLTASTAYWVRVRAVNATGTGPNSSALATGTQTATAPNAPAAPTFSGVGGTSLTVNWVAPGTNGATITGYTLQRSTTSGSSGFTDLITGISASATSVNVTGLNYGTQYWFRIVANSSAGNSTGASATVTTTSTTPFAPAAPTISNITQTTATVSYVAPSDGGSAITGYDIQRASDAAFTQDVVTTAASASPLDITSLMPAIQTWVRVRANNANGNGAWSPATSFTPLGSAYVYKGSTWVGCQVYVWKANQWVLCTTQKWNGSAWV